LCNIEESLRKFYPETSILEEASQKEENSYERFSESEKEQFSDSENE
jgi:hypothetical protein